MPEFEVGRIYNRRREIHDAFGGQQQGGMATPQEHPYVFLFTAERGSEHGYRDEFREDGTFWYTGEGQVGDQEFHRCNKTLRDHIELEKTVHLFEEVGRGDYQYVGEFEYLGHHLEQRPDNNTHLRNVIVFELGNVGVPPIRGANAPPENEPLPTEKNLVGMDLSSLRRLALAAADLQATAEERRRVVRLRSAAVKAYVLKRAGGKCEGCTQPAPFNNRRLQPYLEPHHTTRLTDGGPDHPAHVIALCPNCHRRVHHGEDGQDYNLTLIKWLFETEER